LVACACPAEFGVLSSKEKVMPSLQHFRDIGIIRDKDFPPSLQEWLKGFETISPIHWIDKISPRPLLLLHGDGDEVVPVKHARQLYQKAKDPKELRIIPGARHKLRLDERAVSIALDWLKARC